MKEQFKTIHGNEFCTPQWLFDSSDNHPGKIRKGDKHWCAKLSSLDLIEIKKLYTSGLTQKECAAKFLIHPASVSRIVRNKWRK